jgi:F420-dependent methylenetetrahydromethanopterin dehydrogenase
VALEDEYRTYRDTIATAIAVLRPRAKVETATLDDLGKQMKCFDPQVVVCSRPNTVKPGTRTAWVQLSLDPTRPTKICVGGRYSELTSPTLELLLKVIDETEQLTQRQGEHVGC